MDDPAYKRLLTHQRIVKDLLIGFIAPRRPSGWVDALDFDTLREGPTENVTDELRRRLGDVVWSIDRRDGRGGVHTLHVVIEHQSSVDYSMPLRFLNYTSLLYQRLYRERTKWSKSDTADPVLHVVVYRAEQHSRRGLPLGDCGWTGSIDYQIQISRLDPGRQHSLDRRNHPRGILQPIAH